MDESNTKASTAADVQRFFLELQDKLNQDKSSTQASPVYYGILDYQQLPASEYRYDDIQLYDIDTCETLTAQEFFDEADDDQKHEWYIDYSNTGIDMDDEGHTYIESEDTFTDYVQDNFPYIKMYVQDVSFISLDCMFLTREDAETYLRANKHNFTSRAHTYAMTAYRSHRYAKLLKSIQNIDWDKSTIVLK